jgi:DnaJ-class molecular chaperone
MQGKSDYETYYAVLGGEEDSTPDEIKAAFRSLARDFHPDVIPDGHPRLKHFATQRFTEILEAYDVLKDQEKRTKYNEALVHLRMSEKTGHAFEE